MKITLRRANALQASIQEALKSIELKTEIAIDEFQNVKEVLTQGNLQLMININRQKDLLTALYNIRQKVCQANADSGIDVNLTNMSFVSKRLEQLAAFTSATVKSDQYILEAKLDKIRNSSESYYEKFVRTGVLSEVEINSFKKEILALKKQKVELADALLALNVGTEIVLDETTVTILTKENLL